MWNKKNSVWNLIKWLGCNKSEVVFYFNVYNARHANKPTIRPHTLQSNMPRNMQWYIFFMNSDKGYSLVYWWHLFSRMNGRLNWLCHMLSHIIILNRTTLVIESHMIQNKRNGKKWKLPLVKRVSKMKR